MTRRGMDTTVGRRIREQQRQAAQARVQRLNERRQLERERESVARSIRDVSVDLAAARRDLVVHQPSLDLADIRRQAREEWLALRAAQRAAESGSESTAGKSAADIPKVPLEEVRRQAREAWLEGRRTGKWDQSKEADRGAERGDSSPDRGLGPMGTGCSPLWQALTEATPGGTKMSLQYAMVVFAIRQASSFAPPYPPAIAANAATVFRLRAVPTRAAGITSVEAPCPAA